MMKVAMATTVAKRSVLRISSGESSLTMGRTSSAIEGATERPTVGEEASAFSFSAGPSGVGGSGASSSSSDVSLCWWRARVSTQS